MGIIVSDINNDVCDMDKDITPQIGGDMDNQLSDRAKKAVAKRLGRYKKGGEMNEIKHTMLCENLNGDCSGIDCPRCILNKAAPRLLEACKLWVSASENRECAGLVQAYKDAVKAIAQAEPK